MCLPNCATQKEREREERVKGKRCKGIVRTFGAMGKEEKAALKSPSENLNVLHSRDWGEIFPSPSLFFPLGSCLGLFGSSWRRGRKRE